MVPGWLDGFPRTLQRNAPQGEKNAQRHEGHQGGEDGFFGIENKNHLFLDIFILGESSDLQSTIFARNMDMKLSKA